MNISAVNDTVDGRAWRWQNKFNFSRFKWLDLCLDLWLLCIIIDGASMLVSSDWTVHFL